MPGTSSISADRKHGVVELFHVTAFQPRTTAHSAAHSPPPSCASPPARSDTEAAAGDVVAGASPTHSHRAERSCTGVLAWSHFFLVLA